MYVRAYLAIPCVSANDNIKHVKLNIKYVFYNRINKLKYTCAYMLAASGPVYSDNINGLGAGEGFENIAVSTSADEAVKSSVGVVRFFRKRFRGS